jgi:hypothetical protein
MLKSIYLLTVYFHVQRPVACKIIGILVSAQIQTTMFDYIPSQVKPKTAKFLMILLVHM